MKFIPNAVSRKAALALLQGQKHSPAILFGAGVVGVIGTVVLSSKATLKVGDILDETNEKLAQVREAAGLEREDYTDKDANRDRLVVYSQAAMKLTKLYAPAFALGVLSIAALGGSHYILTKRNAALTAAYAALDKSYKEYRQRVVAAVGEDKEREIFTPTEEVEVIDENGKKTKKKVGTGEGGSPYARVFDEYNVNWNHESNYNQMFIRTQQNWANDLLKSQGYLVLNDVYQMLGLEKSSAGAVVGWVYDSTKGDGYVDFGVTNTDIYQGMRFINGEERSVWLDFNVDGVIYDQIDKIDRGDY